MKNSEMPMEDMAWFRQFISDTFWKPARTYAKTAPHEYTVREWAPLRDDHFVHAVITIRQYGDIEYFYRKPFTYLFLDGLKYWTMGESLDKTTLINRCPWENVYGQK